MSLAVLVAVGALAPGLPVTFTIDARPGVTDAAVGVAPCRDGRTRVEIRSPGGSSSLCHLFTSKTATSGHDPKSIVDRVIETDALPGGTIVSRATYTFRFAATACGRPSPSKASSSAAPAATRARRMRSPAAARRRTAASA